MEDSPPDVEDLPDVESLRAMAEREGMPFELLYESVYGDYEPPLSVVSKFGQSRLMAKAMKEEPEPVYVDGERFLLIRRVGTGTYGTVYEARDTELDRRVALKVMPVGDPDVADREGKALAAVEHDNIVQIFDHGREDNYRWLVLEFIDGPTLDHWCAGKSAKEILARFLEAGEGLDAAHRRGLIHRDFKPGNVMINDKGRAVVTDFGLARNLESLNERSPEDGSLIASGTLGFLSRERLQGNPGDEKSDQFAFCVSLWWALTGEHPFKVRGELRDYFASMGKPPKNRRKVPRRMRRVLERGMAPLPGDRWRTMSEVLSELQRAGTPRWPWLFAGIAIAASSMAVGPALTTKPPESKPEPEPDPAVVEVNPIERAHEALRVGKDEEAFDALWEGYSDARQGVDVEGFLTVVMVVANRLEKQGHPTKAMDCWWMVLQLSLRQDDEELARKADSNLERLRGKGKTKPAATPRRDQLPQSK